MHTLRRRGFVAGGLAAVLLAGCGFRLRQAPVLAFRSWALSGASPALADELQRTLGASLVPLAPGPGQAAPEVVLEVLEQTQERSIVGVNASGQVRELQLHMRLQFRLRTPAGRELIAATVLRQQRDISFNETVVLSKEAEEALLFQDMQSSVVQQLLRRLAAVKSLD